jgi:hypothetical protein
VTGPGSYGLHTLEGEDVNNSVDSTPSLYNYSEGFSL